MKYKITIIVDYAGLDSYIEEDLEKAIFNAVNQIDFARIKDIDIEKRG